MSGRLVILSGPSGVGKDTVLNCWRERDPNVVRVVACTTRSPRVGERDGVDYHFLSQETFDRMAADGAFLEYKIVHGNCYATPLKEMDRLLQEGKTAVLKIDVQGGIEAMEKRPDATSIFILPPSMDALEHRIRSRGQDDPEAMRRRLTDAYLEVEASAAYHYRIVNDEVGRCVQEILDVLARHAVNSNRSAL